MKTVLSIVRIGPVICFDMLIISEKRQILNAKMESKDL